MATVRDSVERKIRIQPHGINISPELKAELSEKEYYPINLFWIEDVAGPFSFSGYGEGSPFELRKLDDGGYGVWEKGEFFSKVHFYKKPRFFDRRWPEGSEAPAVFVDEGFHEFVHSPCSAAAPEEGDLFAITSGSYPHLLLTCYNGLLIWPSWTCLYTRVDRTCRFCCLPPGFDESKVLAEQPGWFEKMADTVGVAVEEIGPHIGECTLTVDSGTFPGRDKGAGVYAEVLRAIKRRLGKLPETLYIRAVSEPPQDEDSLYELAEAGFNSVQFDIDVFDEDHRRRIMPNAKGFRPVADYLRLLEKSKSMFIHSVESQLIVGIQTDEELLAGVERLAEIGVPASVVPFLPFGEAAILAKEEGYGLPTADRMRRVYLAAAEILSRHGVEPPAFKGVGALPEVMGKSMPMAECFVNNTTAIAQQQ